MAKIFSVNFNKSVNDKFGATTTLGSTAKLGRDEKGLALKCQSLTTDYITYGDIAAINSIGIGEFSFVVGANTKGFLNHGSIFNTLSGKGNIFTGFELSYISSTSIRMYVLNQHIDATINTNKNNLYILTRNSAGLCTFYINGEIQGTPTAINGSISTNFNMSIGFDGEIYNRTPNASIYLSEVYNHCLSQQEIDKLTSEFQQAQPISKPKRGFEVIKPTDLSRYSGSGAGQGLIAAYNCKPIGNTLVDISGNGLNLSVTDMFNTKDGLKSKGNGSNSSLYTATPILDNATTWTVACRFSEYTKDSFDFIFGGSTNKSILLNRYTTNIAFRDSGSTYHLFDATSDSIINIAHDLVFVANGTTVSLYVDGVFDSAVTPVNTQIYINDIIQGYDTGVYTASVNLIDFKAYNRVLSLQEIKDYHNSFIQPTLIEDFSSEGADGQTKVPTDWQLISGTYKVGEINLVKGELLTNGTFETDTNWTKETGWTINTTTKKAVSDGTQTTKYIFQSPITTLGKFYKITADIVVNSGACKIGFNSTLSPEITTSGTYTVSGIASASSNAGLVFALNTTNFNGTVDNVTCVEIPNNVPTIKQGTKYLENVTAGVIAIPSQQAYGTWEFDWYKGAGGNGIFITLINSESQKINFQGYYVVIASDETIRLYKANTPTYTSILQTITSYIANNTWYRTKITRTSTGIFTVLIKGGTFTPTAGYDGWTLVSITGGSGSNPVTDNTYTTSNYFVADLDQNDRLTNLCIFDSVEQ